MERSYKLITYYSFVFIALSSLFATAQRTHSQFDVTTAREAGIPPIQNHIWDKNSGLSYPRKILQHPNRLLYVLCKEGIAEFDGTGWELIYKRAEGTHIYSFSISEQGAIYLIISNDFGVLEKQGSGSYYFKSMLTPLDDKPFELGSEIGCFSVEDEMYFAFRKYVFRLKNQKLLFYEMGKSIRSVFNTGNKIYIQGYNGKLYAFADGKVTALEGRVFKSISLNLKIINNRLWIVDEKGQFYTHDQKGFNPIFKLPEGIDFSDRTFLPIDDHRIAVGSESDGLLMYSTEGKLLSVLDKQRGFVSNEITDLYLDKDKNLWVAHAKGISKIEVFSPFSFYDQRNTPNPFNYIEEHDQHLYAVSHNKVYELNFEERDVLENQHIRKIFSSNDFVNIFTYKDLLLFKTSNGLFAYKDQKTYKVLDGKYPFLMKSTVYDGILYGIEAEAIIVYKDLGTSQIPSSRFMKAGTISIKTAGYTIAESEMGSLLIIKGNKKIIRVRIKSMFPLDYQSEEVEVPSNDYWAISWVATYKPTIRIDSLLFEFNDKKIRFEEHPINKSIQELKIKPYIVYQKDSVSDMLLSTGTRGKMLLGKRSNKGNYQLLDTVFKRFPEEMDIYTAFQDSKDMIWLGTENGLVLFDPRVKRNYGTVPQVLIKDLSLLKKDSLIARGNLHHNDPNFKLQYNDNSIKVRYAFPDFNDTNGNRFAHKLEGFNDYWSDWTSIAEKEFTNLPEGTYHFKVKAKNVYEQESAVSSFTFVILPPWYRSWWAYFLYVLGFIAITAFIVRWRSSTLEKEKGILEAIVQKRTQEIIEKSEQLEVQAAKLKEMDVVKSRFFANISHEFRTPITLIKGPVQEFINNTPKGLDRDKLKMVGRNADRLLQLVNQLLDLSKLDTGNLKLEPEEADLNHFLRSISAAFDSHATQRNIFYEVMIDEDVIMTSFDKDKLEKIIINLLSNAFKYTPDKGVITFTSILKSNQVEIVISDNGIGVSAEKLPYIFDRFYQVDASETRHQEGTGIGLALVKELVALYKGEIRVESTPKLGTTFRMILPLPYVKEVGTTMVKSVNETIPEQYNLTISKNSSLDKDASIILVVEDNEDMRKYIIDYLRDEFHILEAVHGIEGLQMARDQIPDLIITDVMMPQLDGISMCEQLKADEKTSHIPIVMLTAKADQEDKLTGLDIGIDDYLVKPFDSKELKIRVHNLIQQRNLLRKRYSQQITLEPKQIAITSREEVFLEKVIEGIETNIADEYFGVPQMQELLSMSKTQLHRKIKALTDQGPGEFLRNYRLKKAAQMLANNKDTISQVAYAVGFNSVSYFTKCFKVFYSISPSAYKKQQAKNK